MPKPKKMLPFSVLMSVYFKENSEYLEQCLDSILVNQSVIPNEIVMVKDGPLTKELEKVLKKYDKKFPNKFKFVTFSENKGLGLALQKGLEECSYDIIMRMDTDDVCMPNRFKTQLEYMQDHPDVSIVGGFIEEFVDSPEEVLRLKEMPLTYDAVKKYAKFRNPLNHMTVCFRKKDILEVGNYQPLYYLEDQYLWSRALVNGKKINNIAEVLVRARIGNEFDKRRGNKNYIKGWKFLQKYLYNNHYTNIFERVRNIICMEVFIYVPNNVRKFFYKKLLRKSN